MNKKLLFHKFKTLSSFLLFTICRRHGHTGVLSYALQLVADVALRERVTKSVVNGGEWGGETCGEWGGETDGEWGGETDGEWGEETDGE